MFLVPCAASQKYYNSSGQPPAAVNVSSGGQMEAGLVQWYRPPSDRLVYIHFALFTQDGRNLQGLHSITFFIFSLQSNMLWVSNMSACCLGHCDCIRLKKQDSLFPSPANAIYQISNWSSSSILLSPFTFLENCNAKQIQNRIKQLSTSCVFSKLAFLFVSSGWQPIGWYWSVHRS